MIAALLLQTLGTKTEIPDGEARYAMALNGYQAALASLQIGMANPHITHMDGEVRGEEGCLSVPGIYEEVTRAERVKVNAQDRHGQPLELEADGLLAICIQHEIDHLDGKVFVEYLSQLKQTRIKGKLAKKARITA